MGLGWIAKVLSFARVTRSGAKADDTKCDPGGGANKTAQHFPPLGDDSYPLPTDYAVVFPVQRSGVTAAVGYVDPLNEGVAIAGEKRTYARDADGGVVVEQHMKTDGECIIFNDKATIVLKADGSIKYFNENGSSELKADGTHVVTNTSGATQEVNIDGSVNTTNSLGFAKLLATGIVDINGVTILPSTGEIIAPLSITVPTGVYSSSLQAGGKELRDHTHIAGIPPGNTGPNN